MTPLDGQEREQLRRLLPNRQRTMPRPTVPNPPDLGQKQVLVPLTGPWYEARIARCVAEYNASDKGSSATAVHIGELRGLAEGLAHSLTWEESQDA